MRVFRPTARSTREIDCSVASENLYDQLGRVYRTKTYAVDPDDGSVGDALVSNTWRDAAGRTIKQQGAGSQCVQQNELRWTRPRDRAVRGLRYG